MVTSMIIADVTWLNVSPGGNWTAFVAYMKCFNPLKLCDDR